MNLQQLKADKVVTIKRICSGFYSFTIGDSVFEIENCERSGGDAKEWVVHTVSGPCHDNEDSYVTHTRDLYTAQSILIELYLK